MSKHTVGISLNDDEYAQLKELAEEQDRYISGQARHMLRQQLQMIRAIDRHADTHMVGAGGAAETSSAPPVPSATYVDPHNTSKSRPPSGQEPLPG